MSSKSDGAYDNNFKVNTTISSVKDQASSYTYKEDDLVLKCINDGKTNLATFSQPQQQNRAFKISENKSQLKTLSFTNTPIREYNTMQQPPQQHSSSQQPVPMSSKMSTAGIIGTLPRPGILKQSNNSISNNVCGEGSMQIRAVVSPTRPILPGNNGSIQPNAATPPTTMLRLGTNPGGGNNLYLPNRPRDAIVCTMPNCSGKPIICSQEELGISPSRGYECDSDTNSGVSGSIQRPPKTFNSSCQQCMVERAACKMSSTNLTTLGIASPESSFAESSISSNPMSSPSQPNIITSTLERGAPLQIGPSHQVMMKPVMMKKPYINPVPPSLKSHQNNSSTLINANTIPMSNAPLHSSPRSIATQAVCKLPQEVDGGTSRSAVSTTTEFSSLQSERQHGSMDDLFSEETRGERPATVAPPGRTYECETWCRETFRIIAGCLGICALTLSYAAFGGFMFMAVENSVVLNNPSSVSYYDGNQGGRRGFIVSVEPAAAVSSTNFATAAIFSSKNSSVLDLERSNKVIDKARLATVKKLWDITEQMNILYPENWTRIAAQELAKFQETMVHVLVKEWQKAAKISNQQRLRGYNTNQIISHNKNSLASPTSSSHPSPSRSSVTVRSKMKNVINKETDSMDANNNDKIRSRNEKEKLKKDSSDTEAVDSKTTSVRAVYTSPHYRTQNRQRTVEWTFAMGLLYSVSLLTTVGSGMDWELSSISRLLTVGYLLIGVPIMFMYLKTTGGLAAKAIRLLTRQIITCHKRQIVRKDATSSRNSCGKKHSKSSLSLCYSTMHSSTASSSVNNSNSNIVSSIEPLDRGDRQVATVAAIDANGREKISLSSFSNTSGAGSKRLSVGDGSRSRSTWQTRGNSLSSGKSLFQNKAGNNVLHVSPSIGSIDTLNESEVLMSSQKEIYKGKPSIVLPILGCICLLILYITCGAAFVADTQNIEFSDAFYFCFVALCTVGFGGEWVRLSSDLGIWLIVIYIFLGVTLLSTTLHIVHQDACVNLQRYRQFKKKKLKPGSKTSPSDITKNDHSIRSNEQFSLRSKNVNNLVADA